MRFAEIEILLGVEALSRIEESIVAAYQTAGARPPGLEALRVFLVGMLAAVVTTERHLPTAEQLAAEDAALLNALVRKIKEIAPHRLSTPPPAAVSEVRLSSGDKRRHSRLVRPTVHKAAVTAETGRVIPFQGRARQQPPTPAAEAPTEGVLHAGLCAARSAIARKRELTAQKREVLARAQVLLEKSRSLRTALAAAEPGRRS
jgi:hypothetical protein